MYLFTSTYVLIIIGAVFWYYRSRSYVKDHIDAAAKPKAKATTAATKSVGKEEKVEMLV